MKILHITPSYKPAFTYGGPTVSVSRLCEELANAGEEVDVFTTTANGSEELSVQAGEPNFLEGVRVTYFCRLTGDHTHFSPALLLALWKQGKDYDIIHIHSWWNLVSVFSVLLCWIKGWRPLLAPRGMLSTYSFQYENSTKKKLIHNLLGKYLLSRTILHATTTLEVRGCQRIIPNWKYILLPNIVSLPSQPYEKQALTGDNVLKLVFLSRLDPKKGLELLFAALSGVNFPFQLYIFGNREDAYENQLRQLASQHNLCNYISWQGWVEGEEKFNKLAAADLFVLTSYNENFANVVLESLSVNTPVLLSDQVGLADYVRDENLGWVCTLTEQDITDKLQTAYNAIKNNNHLFNAGFEAVKRDFQPSTLANQYIQQYHLLKSKKNHE